MTSVPGATAERPCPVCGTHRHRHFAHERIDPSRLNSFSYSSRKIPEFMCLRLVRCLGCDLVYAPEPPSENALHGAYAEADFDSAQEAVAAAKTYAGLLAPFVTRLKDRHSAADIGAGSGPLLPYLLEQGFETVVGVEPSRAAIDAAPPEIRPMLRQGLFAESLLQDLRLSLVCSFMTLEHLRNPGHFVRTAWGLLEPGGMLAIVVHDWRAPLNRLLGRRSPIIDVEHLQLFSPRSVDALLTSCGFESITRRTIRNTYPLRYWLRLMPLPESVKRIIMCGLARFGLADTLISVNVGNVLAVGFKPHKEQL